MNSRGKLIDLSTPMVMGILNLTPDSFFDGGKYADEKSIIAHAVKMVEDGASLIDVGGQSTRPGAKMITAEVEWKRLSSLFSKLRKELPNTILSVDAFYAEVADRAVQEGADMINDVSGGSIDPLMFETIGRLRVPYLLMHMKGLPEMMQKDPHYDDVVTEVMDYFVEKIKDLNERGVVDIILDPGFGFGKSVEHNFQLLSKLDLFKKFFNRPVLVGLSRKSMVNKLLDISAKDALNGTTVLNTVALMKEASIIRVHDVKECMQAIKLVGAL